MATPVPARILAFNEGRDPERLAMKYDAMAEDAFAFFRGTAHLFWQDWPAHSPLDDGPPAWICGDLHLENFGTFKGDDGLTYFDVNDFDEGALASCAWDGVRCVTSILLADHEVPDAPQRLTLADEFIDAYAAALSGGKARQIQPAKATGMVGELLTKVAGRKQGALLDDRTKPSKDGGRRIKTDGEHALPATQKERDEVGALIHRVGKASDDPKFWRVLDVERRVSGLGSLGVERYVVLVEGKGSPDRNRLIDVKLARQTAVRLAAKKRWPVAFRNEADRVVGVQQRLQAASPRHLSAVTDGAASFVVRALQPGEDRLRLKDAKGKMPRLEEALRAMGAVLGWDQLRASGRDDAAPADDLVAFGKDGTWRKPLVEYARGYAEQVVNDWTAFRRARKDGFFADQCRVDGRS